MASSEKQERINSSRNITAEVQQRIVAYLEYNRVVTIPASCRISANTYIAFASGEDTRSTNDLLA